MGLLKRWFFNTVSAIVYSIIDDLNVYSPHGNKNAVVKFVIDQHARMPGYLRLALFVITLFFDLAGIILYFNLFHSGTTGKRLTQIKFCQNSRIGFLRDFAKFYYSLAIVGWTDPYTVESVYKNEDVTTNTGHTLQVVTRRNFDVIVLGGGPGGAITATLLAEEGFDVCLIEEGEYLPLQSAVPFTVQEMIQKYRNGGLTPALGKPKITYVEGRCMGGGSEINSGLYHRTPGVILDHWNKIFRLQDVGDEHLAAYFEAGEKELSVSLISGGKAPKASLMLKKGADKLGWQCPEIPRWFSYENNSNVDELPRGQRQSMTQTYIPRFANAGGNIVRNTRAQQITKRDGKWTIQAFSEGQKNEYTCQHLFIACGAIGTPALLNRSALQGVYGKSLQVHPTIKIVALFDEEVNNENMGVPVHQVKEFAPTFSFGCSISSVPYLQLAMLDHPKEMNIVDTSWRKMAIYYAMIVPEGKGAVRQLPFFSEPLVTYKLTEGDLVNLSNATQKLAELLFAAGAKKLFPSITGSKPLLHANDIALIPNPLSRSTSNLMTIHLFSTCPMGENKKRCTVNSYGKMHGQEDLYICDGSILPSAPGVNPQGSIMAFARRNAINFIVENKPKKTVL